MSARRVYASLLSSVLVLTPRCVEQDLGWGWNPAMAKRRAEAWHSNSATQFFQMGSNLNAARKKPECMPAVCFAPLLSLLRVVTLRPSASDSFSGMCAACSSSCICVCVSVPVCVYMLRRKGTTEMQETVGRVKEAARFWIIVAVLIVGIEALMSVTAVQVLPPDPRVRCTLALVRRFGACVRWCPAGASGHAVGVSDGRLGRCGCASSLSRSWGR